MLQSRTADDTTPLTSSQGPQPTTGLPHSKGPGSTNVLVGNETGWVGWVGGWVGHCNQVLTVVRSRVTAGSLTNIAGKLKERGKRNYLFTGWPASQGQGPHTIPNTPKAMLSEMHFHQQHLGACEKHPWGVSAPALKVWVWIGILTRCWVIHMQEYIPEALLYVVVLSYPFHRPGP